MPGSSLFALALLAFALALLGPICEPAFAAARAGDGTHAAAAGTHARIKGLAQDGAPLENCCDSINDGTVNAKLNLLVAWTAGGAAGVLPNAPGSRLRDGFLKVAAKIASPPQPERSYYARSARILR